MSISLGSDKITLSYNHFRFSSKWANAVKPNNPVWRWIKSKYSFSSLNDLAGERIAMVIGQDGNDTYANKSLHVTMHHNVFGPFLRGRPLSRGYVHMYNNYFKNDGEITVTPNAANDSGSVTSPKPTTNPVSRIQDGAFQPSDNSVTISEGNYFYKTNNTIKGSYSYPITGDKIQYYEGNSNKYQLTTGLDFSTEGKTKFFPKDYRLSKPAENIPYIYTLEPVDNMLNLKVGPQ